MVTKYQPQKASAGASFDWGGWFRRLTTDRTVLSIFNQSPTTSNYEHTELTLTPTENYSGYVKFTPTKDNYILTNPWGTGAVNTFGLGFGARDNQSTLAPGQSINLKTGALSDPRLHASTAARLTTESNRRAVQEAGLTEASQTSARSGATVLSSLDDLYFANTATSVPSASAALSQSAQAKQTGIDTKTRTTLLGIAKPNTPVVSTPIIRSRG